MEVKQLLGDIARTIFELDILLEEYRIGNSNEVISIKDLKLLNIHGSEYLVFKYKDRIVKIHRKRFVDINNLDELNILSFIGVPTKRILMPTDILYNVDGRIEGYVMDCIEDEKNIFNESMHHFLNEGRILESDKKILDEKSILLQDLHENNAIYNGKIYIIDSGRFINTSVILPTYMYLIDKVYMNPITKEELKVLKEKVIKTNDFQLNVFFSRYIMKALFGEINNYEKGLYAWRVREYLTNKATELKTSSYLDVVEKECDKDMTVLEYAKRLKKCIDDEYY